MHKKYTYSFVIVPWQHVEMLKGYEYFCKTVQFLQAFVLRVVFESTCCFLLFLCRFFLIGLPEGPWTAGGREHYFFKSFTVTLGRISNKTITISPLPNERPVKPSNWFWKLAGCLVMNYSQVVALNRDLAARRKREYWGNLLVSPIVFWCVCEIIIRVITMQSLTL